MTERDVRPEDYPHLVELFQKQSFEYELPDFGEPQFIARKVIVDESGTPVMAVCARRTVELYLLGDPGWKTPRWRYEALKLAHEAMRKELVRLGIQDVHAWLPPQVAKSFGRRLMNDFGWVRPLWTDFSAKVDSNG